MAETENNQGGARTQSETATVSELQRALVMKYVSEFGNKVEPAEIGPRPSQEPAPVSFSQQQVWLHAQMACDIPFYNQAMTIYRRGSLDVAVLERCLLEMIRRNEIWRTTFDVIRDEPVQIVQPALKQFPWKVINLSALPEAEREREALRLATEDVRRPFDLKTGPLLRALLISFDDQHHRLYMTFHHLVFDGVTAYEILLPELEKLYEAFSAGKPSPLPEPTLQYADFAYWQRKKLSPEVWSSDLGYWRQQLGGELPSCQWPNDRPRPIVESHRGAVERFVLPVDVAQRIRVSSQQAGVTVYVTLLAGLVALLHRYTSQNDLVVGCLTSGRDRAELEQMMGYFVNPLALRIDLTGDPTFRELQARVRKVVFDALAHQNVPFVQVVKEVGPRHDPGRNPLFQVILSQQPQLHSVSGWNLVTDEVSNGGSELDLLIVADDRGNEIFGPITYNTDLFDAATVQRMVGHWSTLLASACEHPQQRISELPFLTESERWQILVDWNDTARSQAQVPVHEVIEEQARKLGNAVAVQCGTRQLTYAELDAQANRVAEILRKFGVGPDVPVAIRVERSVEMIAGILGILKAGGAYVPLDPTYPRERIEFILSDCKPKALLTQSRFADTLACDIPTVFLDSLERKEDGPAPTRCAISLENLAYIIYTSGSTGVPKGVLVTHGNLAHSNQARSHQYGESKGNFLLLSSYAFDSSVAGIFHCLSTGGTLVIPNEDFRWQPEQLAVLISGHDISQMLCFPSLYAELLDHALTAQLASLRTVIVAGEACPRQLVNSHYRILPQASLFNEYGPTEATVWSTVYECEPGEADDSVPIGRPIANTQVYVLDGHFQPVAAGISGELFIGGGGVTAGYLNRPDLTRTSFVANPFNNDSSARLYRTGDLVRYRRDGILEFLGRMDQQVKVHGLRIELGEIEAALRQHPEVREAVVIAQNNGSGDLKLTAFVVTRENSMSSGDEQRRFLQSRLPAYMIPASFHFPSSLPLTPNGKVDRQRLLDSESVGARPERSISTPRNEVEERLLAIWQRILKTDSMDVTQDFFEQGGHSLLAAKLLANIEREFGRMLSLAFIFQCPTIEQMAESLQTAGQSLRDRAIVPIQPKGSRPPLFWIRGGPRFRLLARKLGPEQPFLGLYLPFADGSRLPVPYRMEDIAGLLIRALREAQPRGPYYLAGLCVNAVLAYEVARQLQQGGEEVALLAMFDGHNNAYYKKPWADGRYSQRIKYHLSNLLQMDALQTPAYVLDRLDEARRKIERLTWQLMSDRSDRLRNTDSIVHPAFHRYEPQTYPGKIVLLQSSDWPAGPYFDFKLGWVDRVEGGIEFQRIPGDHPSMFTEPNVNLVAEALRHHLPG